VAARSAPKNMEKATKGLKRTKKVEKGPKSTKKNRGAKLKKKLLGFS
jgi:hypothetical protein